MINFDLDTNKYEILTHKAAPTAYSKIRRFILTLQVGELYNL